MGDPATLAQWMNCCKGVVISLQALYMQIQGYEVQRLTNDQIKVDRARVAGYRNQMTELSMAVFKLCENDDAIRSHSATINIQVRYLDKMELKLADWDKLLNVDTTPVQPPLPPPLPAPAQAQLKLPKLELMTFDGRYSEWLAFKDLFKAAIIDNNSLSNAQKLQYLKTTLKGEAERIVKSFPITHAIFQEAWKLLEKRYNNLREVVFAILKKFFSQPQEKVHLH